MVYDNQQEQVHCQHQDDTAVTCELLELKNKNSEVKQKVYEEGIREKLEFFCTNILKWKSLNYLLPIPSPSTWNL